MTAPKARWRVADDGIHVVKATPDGEILEAPKTRYGSLANAKSKAAALNRAEKEATK